MTDHEWAEAFVSCKIAGTGSRFAATVDILARKLAQVRQEAAGLSPERRTGSPDRGTPHQPPNQAA